MPLPLDSGLAGRMGFLRGGQLLRAQLTVNDDQIIARPFPQPRGALRPRLEAVLGDRGDLGHRRVPIHDVPLCPDPSMQLMAHHGLMDQPGGLAS